MKVKYYLLLISVVGCWLSDLKAQTKPASPPKQYKSSPVQTATPRIKTQQSAPVATPGQSIGAPQSRPAAAPAKDSMYRPSALADPNSPVSGGLVSLGFVVGIPQGEFKATTDGDAGFGFDISILANLASGKRTPQEWSERFVNVYVGGGFQYMRQNGVTDNHTEQNSFSTTSIESKVVNNMYALNAVSRVEIFPGLFKVFAEVSAGGRLFNGVHKLHVEDVPRSYTNPNDVRETDYRNGLSSSVVGNVAYGGGFRIGSEQVKMELKVMYVKGTTADYVDIESIKFNRADNSVTYSTQRSATDMIIPQLSVSIGF